MRLRPDELRARALEAAEQYRACFLCAHRCGVDRTRGPAGRGYESVEALRLLEGVVDIYLPDAKYGDDAAGLRFSGCAGYTAALAGSLREMHRQAGPLQVGPDGLATRGVLVRHLVLPGGAAGPDGVMQLVAAVSSEVWVNVLSQYRPVHEASRFPLVARTVHPDEVRAALGAAHRARLRN